MEREREMEMEMEADPDSSSPSAGADGAATASGETKACAACHTTKTPLWRGGPEGPKVCPGFDPSPIILYGIAFLLVCWPADRSIDPIC